MKKTVKCICIGVVVLSAVIGSVVLSLRPLAVAVVTAEYKPVQLYFVEQGIMQEAKTIEIFTLASGSVLEIPVNENDHVYAGDIICRIDPSQYQAQINQLVSANQALASQMANLDEQELKESASLRADREQLRGQLKAIDAQAVSAEISIEEQIKLQEAIIAQDERNLFVSQKNLQDAAALYENGVMPAKDYENIRHETEQLESTLAENALKLEVIRSGDGQTSPEYFEGMRQSIQSQINGVDQLLRRSFTGSMKTYYLAQIEANLASISYLEQQVADCTIKAPASGIISQLNIQRANAAMAGTPIAILESGGGGFVEAYVATKDIDGIVLGSAVELIVRRQQDDLSFQGTITAIDEKAVMKISPLGIEERRVKIEISPGGDAFAYLKPGFDVDVRFITYEENGQIAVPKTAVFKIADQEMVWKIMDGKAILSSVETGVELRTEIVITEGVLPGDQVVINADTDGIKEGKRLTNE